MEDPDNPNPDNPNPDNPNPDNPDPENPPAAFSAEITMENGEKDKDEIWHQTLSAEKKVSFTWTSNAEADAWQVALTGANGEIERKTVAACRYSYTDESLAAGAYTLTITAVANDETLGSESLRFVLEAQTTGDDNPDPDNPDPEIPSGPDHKPSRPSGGFSRPSGGGSGGASGGVVAGKALTSTHAKGTGDLTPYAGVRLDAAAGAMDTLALGGQELAVDCSGAPFTATVLEGELLLRSESADWRFTQAALNTLSASGVNTLTLATEAGEVRLDTALRLTGPAYAAERAEGFVSSDFEFSLEEGDLFVSVEDRTYRVDDNQLIRLE